MSISEPVVGGSSMGWLEGQSWTKKQSALAGVRHVHAGSTKWVGLRVEVGGVNANTQWLIYVVDQMNLHCLKPHNIVVFLRWWTCSLHHLLYNTATLATASPTTATSSSTVVTTTAITVVTMASSDSLEWSQLVIE